MNNVSCMFNNNKIVRGSVSISRERKGYINILFMVSWAAFCRLYFPPCMSALVFVQSCIRCYVSCTSTCLQSRACVRVRGVIGNSKINPRAIRVSHLICWLIMQKNGGGTLNIYSTHIRPQNPRTCRTLNIQSRLSALPSRILHSRRWATW